VRLASVTAESTLTRDTVPVNVDAIVFWMVWNAEKAILEVESYLDAITLSAQTALRESIGRHELAQLVADREVLGRELKFRQNQGAVNSLYWGECSLSYDEEFRNSQKKYAKSTVAVCDIELIRFLRNCSRINLSCAGAWDKFRE
jgi:hypothetical protein